MADSSDAFSIKIARNLELDVLALVDTRMAICANSGGGKSHAMRLLVERVAGKIPVHLLDADGEFGTIRSMLDAVPRLAHRRRHRARAGARVRARQAPREVR